MSLSWGVQTLLVAGGPVLPVRVHAHYHQLLSAPPHSPQTKAPTWLGSGSLHQPPGQTDGSSPKAFAGSSPEHTHPVPGSGVGTASLGEGGRVDAARPWSQSCRAHTLAAGWAWGQGHWEPAAGGPGPLEGAARALAFACSCPVGFLLQNRNAKGEMIENGKNPEHSSPARGPFERGRCVTALATSPCSQCLWGYFLNLHNKPVRPGVITVSISQTSKLRQSGRRKPAPWVEWGSSPDLTLSPHPSLSRRPPFKDRDKVNSHTLGLAPIYLATEPWPPVTILLPPTFLHKLLVVVFAVIPLSKQK